MAKIYVASSWRNQYYPEVVKVLRETGHEVYDFRNPPNGVNGFRWTDIDENAPNWNFYEYKHGLNHPKAERQFSADLEALEWADTCVLVLPCGRSAHTEAGWMAGKGKRVIVYIPEMVEPELMYKLFDTVIDNLNELCGELGQSNLIKMTYKGFHFKYYNLEEEDPYNDEDSNASMWWFGEKLFYDKISREGEEEFISRMEQKYLDARSRNELRGVHINKFLSVKDHTLLLYLDLWHGKWYPYDNTDAIEEY